MESSKERFAFSLLAVCGILTTSFSLTWGIGSEFHPVTYYINHHAFYIAARNRPFGFTGYQCLT